jgi:uncharacterized repeat protein (TIGR03806 family)
MKDCRVLQAMSLYRLLNRKSLGLLAGLFTLSLSISALPERSAVSLNLPDKLPGVTYESKRILGQFSFGQPVEVITAPGEENSYYIIERRGVISRMRIDPPQREVILDLGETIADFASEQGLFSAAFHPDYPESPYFFVYHTVSEPGNEGESGYMRLARYTMDPATGSVDPDSETILINQYDESPEHQGGTLCFGPEDGYLYLGLGDGGGSWGPRENAQRIDKGFFSGIIRIDVDRKPGNLPPNDSPASIGNYSIPADNPYVGATSFNGKPVDPDKVRTEFWAVGLRNPFRMQFDPASGDLWAGDVGWNSWEELNRIEKGKNYGWPYYEGEQETGGLGLGDIPPGVEFASPYHSFDHTVANSIIVGEVYFGTEFPELVGKLMLLDFIHGNVWALDVRTEGAEPELFAQLDLGYTDIKTDPRTGGIILPNLNNWQMHELVANEVAGATPPQWLSQTGAFASMATLEPVQGVVSFDVNVPFWSDHAIKRRFFAVPEGKMEFAIDDNWKFPEGMIWIKHFDLEKERGNPESRIRLETRFLVKTSDGVYGITYKWNEEQTDAELVPAEGRMEEIPIVDGDGVSRHQKWLYPSRGSCRTCHTPEGGFALGFNTRQLNMELPYGKEVRNQIAAMVEMGYLEEPPPYLHALPALAPAHDQSASLTHRVESYLDANCAQCHQPGGSALGNWDARASTSLEMANILYGDPVRPSANEDDAIIYPSSSTRSVIFQRLHGKTGRMPPLATFEENREAVNLLYNWIMKEAPSLHLYDNWAEDHLADHPDQDGKEDDPDADALSNYGEYLFGRDPLDDGSGWHISTEGVAGDVVIRARQSPNVGFVLEKRPGGREGNWQIVDLPGNELTFPSSYRTFTVRLPVAKDLEEPEFIRIRAVEP